mmetsp:Transcript_9591/g.16845  ORF Transcript_9591/g.16845 Transcript_9591/m.16845 type:complete len:258 (+) Transcript_9591:467-1240(+)
MSTISDIATPAMMPYCTPENNVIINVSTHSTKSSILVAQSTLGFSKSTKLGSATIIIDASVALGRISTSGVSTKRMRPMTNALTKLCIKLSTLSEARIADPENDPPAISAPNSAPNVLAAPRALSSCATRISLFDFRAKFFAIAIAKIKLMIAMIRPSIASSVWTCEVAICSQGTTNAGKPCGVGPATSTSYAVARSRPEESATLMITTIIAPVSGMPQRLRRRVRKYLENKRYEIQKRETRSAAMLVLPSVPKSST